MGKEIKRCVIISGAPESDTAYYDDYLNDSFIICADSGYLKCLAANKIPDIIAGDFDSSEIPDINCEIIKLNVRKDDSDTFYCVKLACTRGFDDITILGGTGTRIDHTYSNILSLNYCREHGVTAKLVSNSSKVFIADKPFSLTDENKYSFFSLFALFTDVENLTISGAQFTLDNYTLKPSEQITQSNAFGDDKVSISFDCGKLIVIMCND